MRPAMSTKKSPTPKVLILDVDGVLTDGKFVYTMDGKWSKTFGSDDNDALCLIKDKLMIHAVSGDKRGFKISQKRVQEDMGLPLDLVSTFERVDWIASRFKLEEVIYMGDGIFDSLVFKKVGYSIAPANAFFKTKEAADFVTQARGGEGAVAEACFHIAETFFDPIDLSQISFKKGSGLWSKSENA